jgi:uncharacterized protein (DUF488 family)
LTDRTLFPNLLLALSNGGHVTKEKQRKPPGSYGPLPHLRTIFTIGTRKHRATTFFPPLKKLGVSRLVDIRRRPDGAFSGFMRKRDLPYLLSVHGISYSHVLAFAPSDELIDWYKAAGGDDDTRNSPLWREYRRRFLKEMGERRVLTEDCQEAQTILRGVDLAIALLCSEEDAHLCHRSLVAGMIAHWHQHIEVQHITAPHIAKKYNLTEGDGFCVL